MKRLNQSGIFKCMPLSWAIQEAESGAVAVSMSFKVLEELDGSKWASWAEYEEFMFYGSWWVIKKDGTINTSAVEQLAKSLGWNGNLSSVTGQPPQKVVQVAVKEETYNDKTSFKGAWMNPADYDGGGGSGGADASAVKGLQSRFGSLLRAAAASAVQGQKPVATAAPKATGPKSRPAPAGETPLPTGPNCKCTIDQGRCNEPECAGSPF